MFLDRLEIQGFKSFVDKTVVNFGDGLTGVVGPNGCGKTNVSDAIRWVLGEQSAKQLRGDSMEDVIFNGAPSRKPIGMAEVHLTFRNDRGILPTEFSEVTISRRVFRSGVSEYFINKTPCRLKDVRDLFFDTGMGSHAYSVIERQMVDHVLSDNSGHRRFLFEEASGITKYKARKKEALNKLEATEGDLTRLNDIVFEIERELRSLARQVGKARKYQRLRDGIRDMDLKITAGRVLELTRGEHEANERWQEEAVRREGTAARLDQIEARLNDQKLALLELERELATAQGGLKDREEARVHAEHQIVLLEERAAGLRRRAEEAGDEAERIRERLVEVGAQEREAEAQRAESRRRSEQAQEELIAREREMGELETQIRQRRHAASERKQLSLDLFSTEAERRGACERIREREALLTERRTAVEARRVEIEQRLVDLGRHREATAERRRGLELELDEARQMLAQVVAAIEAVEVERQEREAAWSAARQDMAVAESRLETLLELKRNFEGVSEGVKALFHDTERPAGLIGMLADVLDIPARFLDAIEASLGEGAAFVLVDGPSALDRALARLRARPSGRATLLDVEAAMPRPLPRVPETAAVLGRASDLVRSEARYRPLVERLLGRVVVVEDHDTAARLAAAHEELRFVSLDGEVWQHGRVRTGTAGSAGGLLHREREIRELTGLVAEQGLSLEAMGRERDAVAARRHAVIDNRKAAELEVDARRDALEGLLRQVETAEREHAWATEEAAERVRERDALDAEHESLGRARARAEQELQAFLQELNEARTLLTDLDAAVHALESEGDQASARVHALREVVLAHSREVGEWEARWARAEQTRRELEGTLEQRTLETDQSRVAIAEIDAQTTGLKSGLDGLRASESDQQQRVAELQQRYQSEKETVATGEDESRRVRFEQQELSELLHQIELDRVQKRAELDRTFERLRTEYEMDPATWSPEPPPAEFDLDAAARDLEESRQRLRGLGAVNLLALEDYSKKRERWQFLTRQREDLLQAKAQLLEAIEKINVTASQLFVETFEKVQVHFRDIFKTLFEGGDAELRPIGEDPLDYEIEIVAKPRGKHLQSISLMSGGERALTAIALLFAIYLVKPSPFCLLDEVDAPLDDANVERFIRMLRRFSDRTQFVVITHNKKTMEAATSLYGVTMEELGVSKLVSVRFERGEAPAAVEPAAELVGAGTNGDSA
jgi:chromosome segregation protein